MKFHMRSLLKSKAQFFILSAFVIVGILYLISKWMQPLTVIDTSSAALMDEYSVFNNIKEKMVYAVNGSKSCEDLTYNLDEYYNYVKNYVLSKGYGFNFNVSISPCYDEPPLFPVVVESQIKLSSPSAELGTTFYTEFVPSW